MKLLTNFWNSKKEEKNNKLQKSKEVHKQYEKTKQKQMVIKKNGLMGMEIGKLKLYQDQMLY